MGKNSQSALSLIDSYLAPIRAEKQAALGKKAETDPSEPTTHPVMKADDGTTPAKTGARAAENKADVEKDYGKLGVTGKEDANAVSAPPSDSIGTQKMDSSEVKGNVQTPKSDKDKPSKPAGGAESPDHPSNATFAEKYSSLITTGNSILQKFASIKPAQVQTPASTQTQTPAPTQTKTAEVAPATTPVPTEPEAKEKEKKEKEKKVKEEAKTAAAKAYPEDAAAGYMAAELIAQNLFGKQASQENPEMLQAVEGIIKAAEEDADNLVEYVRGHMAALQKNADPMSQTPPGEGGEVIPPEALEAMAQGGAGGAEGAVGGGLGGEMGGGAEGGAPAGGDDEAAIDALAQALAEAGVTPEQLAEAVANAGPEGGAAGAAEGGPAHEATETPAKEQVEEGKVSGAQ